MLFEKLLELLSALAVAFGGVAGIGTAADHAEPRAEDAALSGGAADVDEVAAIRAATVLRAAEAVLAELDALGPSEGLAHAADALTQAMDNAPEQADHGLDTAMEAVTDSPAHDAPAGPAEDLPVEVPAGLPGGRP